MADDQVKYSELVFNDNDNFRGLIEALNQVKAKLAELRTEASGLRGELRGASTATRQQQQSTAENAKSAEDLSRKVKQLTDEEARLKAAIAEANRMQKLQAQATTAAAGSLNEMRAKYKLLVAEMGNYNLKTAEGRRKMDATAIEARKLRDEIYKLEAAYGQFGRNVGNYTGALSRFGARLKEAAARFVAFNAAFLSFTGLIRFGRALFEVRKELESSLVTFKALAGEVQGAKLFEEMKEFAFTTPVTLDAAAKATQTMLSFGVAQEKVIDIMKRLGDISAGDGDRLQRLALAYSQATQAGRLMGQDTLQFINSGFNPLYYISLRTGKSMMELRGEMQKAKIPIEMVTQAIVDATSEGGQFNGMLEKQKETMRGAANIMSGAWQNMLNEMGAETQGVIVGVLKWLTQVMQNWRESIRTLRQVAVSVGTAKAALLLYRVAVEASTKATEAETAAVVSNTLSTTANAVATQKATKAKLTWVGVINLAKGAMSGLVGVLKRFAPFAIIAGITWVIQKLHETATEAKRAAEEIKEFEDNAASSVTGTISQYQQLGREWKRLGTDQEERARWIAEHKRLFDELGLSITNANEADRAFSEEGTRAYIDAVKRRAIADAYKERLAQASVRKQDAQDALTALEKSGKAYTYVSGGTIGSSMTGATFSSPGGKAPTAAYAKAQQEFNKALEETLAIEKKIEEFEKGAAGSVGVREGYTPVTTGGGVEGDSGSTGKDKVKDLLTLTRALQDAQNANIENEYKRLEDAEKLRHERFIEDREAELKLLSAKDPRRAVILQQIEEETETHSRKMFEIDEKRRQELIKQSQKEAEEVEKAAKESAKAQYQALEDEWQQEQTKLVERGAKKRELIAAEIAAEINRLQTMLTVQRSLNGEIMTDEERAKIEEWIKLLTELQKKGNFGGLGIGQVFGKGAENVAKKTKGNYSSVIDILFPDWDSDKQNALKGVFDQAKEALNSWMDARKAAADQAKELADDEVNSAESALEREIELRNQGYANDVALRERELADAKATQRKAAEEQKKVAKEQILLDAAMQTSSMITASANILKQFPNPLAWVPMLATMWGAFAYAKVQAYNAAEKSIKFREGGAMLLEGGSHESGHDVNLGVGPDGSNLRAEGGEYFAVINKRNSRKYGSEIPGIVNALNSGRFEEKYIRTTDTAGIMPAVAGVEGGAVDLSAVESGVSELVRQGEKSWSQEGEFRVMRYKNLTRRVRG